MEINIKLMSEAAYITLQKNPEDVFNNIVESPASSLWLREYLGFEPYEKKEYVIEDFELNDEVESLEAILQNAITIYEHLKHLPRYILCNPRFWAWITFEKAYQQAQNAAKIMSVEQISSLWMIKDTRKSLMLGIISRFFFMVQISIEEKKTDKYELTRFIFKNEETYYNFCHRNIGMLKNVTLAVLRAQKEICQKYQTAFMSKQCEEMIKETAKIGSVMLIDIMSQEEIYEIIYPKFVKIILGQ